MPSARTTITTLSLAAIVLTLATRGTSQSPNAPSIPASQTSAPTLKVYSRETIVDVLVTDDKGQPVTGLKQSDFNVLEDGQPQPIRSFREYSKEAPLTSPPTLPPNTWSNAPVMANAGPVRIFLFDRAVSPPEDLERSKQYIAKYLRTMPPGTTVALLVLSPSKGLRLVQGFTSDGVLAASAVESLDVEWGPEPYVDLSYGIAAINQLAAYVAGMHGRKNLIWVLSRPSVPILRDGGLSWGVKEMDWVHQLMDLYDLFTKEQIAIYPLDPRGVHTIGPLARKIENLTDGLRSIGQANAPLMEEAIAEGTGGATSNSNDYQGTIARIVDDTEHFYTLSYVPPRPDVDGHFHPIKITVDRPGVHLTYRTGYNDERPFPLDPIVKQHMIQGPMRLGALPSTQILFNFHVEPGTSSAQPAFAKTALYHTTFTLDPTQIALSETPDGTRTANIELDLGAFDFYGKLVAARSQTFKISVTPGQYAGFYRKPLNLSLAIDLPHGQLSLHAGLFDTIANKVGTLEIPLTVPKK